MNYPSVWPSSQDASREADPIEDFSGERALAQSFKTDCFGPRIPGSEVTKEPDGSKRRIDHGWEVEILDRVNTRENQSTISSEQEAPRVRWPDYHIIIGAHYDTRIYADRSEKSRNKQCQYLVLMTGLLRGCAVRVIRVLPEFENIDVQLVFFDAEDNGYISGWDWIVGSEQYAETF